MAGVEKEMALRGVGVAVVLLWFEDDAGVYFELDRKADGGVAEDAFRDDEREELLDFLPQLLLARRCSMSCMRHFWVTLSHFMMRSM